MSQRISPGSSPASLPLTTLELRLQQAMGQNHVSPSFQPIVEIRSGKIAGFEILARWVDPQVGDISPVSFIPQLEQLRIVDQLTDFLVLRACSLAASWPGSFFLSFNIAPQELEGDDLPRRLTDACRQSGFPINRMQIEITEGTLIEDANHADALMRTLDNMGVRIAIDDFGTGYSNLARLESFPIRKLKIDKQFIHSLDVNRSKRRIAAAVIGLGHSLGITIVAEGVELRAEESVLQNMGCDLGQGWLYGRSVPADEARNLLGLCGQREERVEPRDMSPFLRLHQLAVLYDQAPVGLAFLNTDFRHVRANDRFAAMHGMTGHELEGKAIADVLEGEALGKAESILKRVQEKNETIEHHYYLHGCKYLVLCTRVSDSADEIIGFSLVSMEITA